MTSDGSIETSNAYEALGDSDYQAATVHALLAIRAELRTANLIALAGDRIPLLHDAWGRPTALPPEATQLREKIREELDLPDDEERRP